MLFIALIILGIISVSTYLQTQRLIKANAWVIHTHEVIEKANMTGYYLLEAESKVSLYLLTKNKENIKDIPQIITSVHSYLAALQLLTKDDVYQRDQVSKLIPLVNTKLDLMQKIINDNMNVSNVIALRPATSEKRIELKNEITVLLSNIIKQEKILLKIRSTNSVYHSNISNTFLVFAGLSSELLFLISIIILNYYLNQKESIEKKQIQMERILEKRNKKLNLIKRRFALAVSGSNTGLWDWVVGSEKVYYSYNFRKLLGYTKKEFPDLFSSFEKVMHPDDYDRVFAEVKRHLESKSVYRIEYRLKHKSGEYRWFQAAGESAYDPEEKVVRMSGTLIDVTDKKDIEIMKNEFISIVSHELRTPLTSIHGAISLLTNSDAAKLDPEANQLLSIAKTNSERLIRLINDILDIEKIESGRMEFHLKDWELNDIIKEAIASNQAYANKFSVKLEAPQTIPDIKVNVDHDRLIQVLTNLISNAIKFSPKNQSVNIRTELKDNKTIRVNITDKGEGIPTQFQSQIFQKFSQADSSSTRKHEGTGLGLNISKNIIERLGGTINFTTKIHAGTTFYFDLPVVNTSQSHIDSVKKIVNKGLVNILHVENDTDLAKIINSILSEHANITNIETLKEAETELSKNSFDIAILDLKLSDGSAINLLPDLSKKEIPVIIFSAYEFPHEYLPYVHDVFTKSKTSNEELLEAVIKIIKEKNYDKRTTA